MRTNGAIMVNGAGPKKVTKLMILEVLPCGVERRKR